MTALSDLKNVEFVRIDPETGQPIEVEPEPEPTSGLTTNEALALLAGVETPLVAATGEVHTGAMIALVPSSDDRNRLFIDGGEPLEELHLTLAYLGEAADIPADVQSEIIEWVRALGQAQAPITVNGFGLAHFNPGDEKACWVLLVSDDDDALEVVHHVVMEKLAADDAGFTMPANKRPWIPHVTLIYDSDDWFAELVDRVGPITFDTLRVTFGGVVTDVPLYSTAVDGGGAVSSYHVSLRADAPKSKPWAVVREYDGAIVACHTDHSVAALQLQDLSRVIDLGHEVTFTAGEAYIGEQTLSEFMMELATAEVVDLTGTDDDGNPIEEVAPTGSWEGILAVEGVETGDGREFAPNALTWADPPIPIMWQRQSLGEGHTGSVIAARAEEVWRNPEKPHEIWGRGTFDINGADGAEAYRQVREGFLKGISIDPDNIGEADIEYVYPENSGGALGEDGIEELFGPMPEKMVFHAGRIRGATLVALPAFVEAQIYLTDGRQVDLAMSPPVSGMSMDDDHFAVKPVERAWDPALAAHELIPHHHADDNVPNIMACAAAITRLGVDQSMTDDQRRAAYDHVARHLREAGLVPLPLGERPVVAAAHVITLNDVPPAQWFDEPLDVPSYGALTITDEGRVYGYLAPAGVWHRSFDRKVTVPMGTVDYSRFMKGETVVEGGGRVPVGSITMGCGHAAVHPSVTGDVAAEHYDNTCSLFANVRVGENKNGVWVAGAVMPGVTPEQITAAMSCQLSGDWRPLPQPVNGRTRELRAALLVPVPGFPMARTQPSVRVSDGELVASAVPIRMIRGHEVVGKNVDTSLVASANALKARLGLDPKSRAAKLRERLLGGQN